MRNRHSKNTVRYYLILIIALIFLFFSGDFGMIDVQKTAIVMAVGIDREEDTFIVTSQIAIPKSSKQGKATETVELLSRGKTVAAAFEEINQKTGWYPKLVFCQLILLGEETAKHNVFDALDFFLLDEYMTDNCLVATCDGLAKDMLNITALVDPSGSIAMQKVLSPHAKRSGTTMPNTLKNFAIGYKSQSKSSFLPIIKTQPSQEEISFEKDSGTKNTANSSQSQQEIFSNRESGLKNTANSSKLQQEISFNRESGTKNTANSSKPQQEIFFNRESGTKNTANSFKPQQEIFFNRESGLKNTANSSKPQQEISFNRDSGLKNTASQEDSSSNSSPQEKGKEEKKPVFSAGETALFYNGVRVGKLTEKETFALHTVKGELRLATYSVDNSPTCTLSIKSNQPKIKCKMKSEQISVQIEVALTAGLLDYAQSLPLDSGLDAGDVPKGVFETANENLANQIRSAFETCQKCHCDLFGVLDALQKQNVKFKDGINALSLNVSLDVSARFQGVR